MNQIGNLSTNAASATVVTLIPTVLNDQNNDLLINKSNTSLNSNNRKKKIINNILNNESLQFNGQNMLVDQSALASTSIANATRVMTNNNNNIIEMPLISEGKYRYSFKARFCMSIFMVTF